MDRWSNKIAQMLQGQILGYIKIYCLIKATIQINEDRIKMSISDSELWVKALGKKKLHVYFSHKHKFHLIYSTK